MSDIETDQGSQSPTFGDYVRILRRRKWHVLATAILVTALTAVISLSQNKVYRASTNVLLSRQDIAAMLNGGPQDPALSEDPARYADTQATVARSGAVAQAALAKGHVNGLTADELLGESSVTPSANADVLAFSVDDPDPARAAQLANAYAAAFASYKLALDTTALTQARGQLNQQIASLRARHLQATPQYRNLVNSEQQLHTMQLLQSQDTVLGHPTAGARIKPTPTRDALLGLGLGVLLGLGLAFAVDALDRRIRSDEEIEGELGLPLLALLPKPPAQGTRHGVTMIAKPRSAYAEGIRRLATSIGFADPDGEAKVVMVTSAVQREGKSTTVANLGVALARAGNDVVLVDLDLRQPTLAGLFGISRLSGLTDVAVRKATLDDALVGIDVPAILPDQARAAEQLSLRGSLCVLPSGPLPANPGEFAASDAVASRILAPLRERFDYVIVDSPPMCVVGDASSISPRVDAIVVVTRLGVLNRPALRDLKRQLAAAPARALGAVITEVDVPPAYGYAGYYEPALDGAASNGKRPAGRVPRTPA